MRLALAREVKGANMLKWPFWAALSVTTTLVGAQSIYAAASNNLAGNIKDAGKLSTKYPHVITGFRALIHSSIMLDMDYLAHGIVCTFRVSGTVIMDNVLMKYIPGNIGVQGAASDTNTTSRLEGAGFVGKGYSFRSAPVVVDAGEEVEALVNIPAALASLSATTVISFWTDTLRQGYIKGLKKA